MSGDICALVTACPLKLINFIYQPCLFSGFYRAVYENSFCSNKPDLPDNKAQALVSLLVRCFVT